jgi:hypothetical protein
VGDIKPMEVPLTFALTLAWDINSIKGHEIGDFFKLLAGRMFGSNLAQAIGDVWLDYDRLVSIRRHEHIESHHFSLINYNEADMVFSRWNTLLQLVVKLYDSEIEENLRHAFFELVLFPVKASRIFTSLQINLARNKLWGEQRRNSANKALRDVLDLFEADFDLTQDYHALLDGKWNRIMSQPHYGQRESFETPIRDMVDGLCFVQTRQNSSAGAGQLGVAVEGHEGIRPGRINEASDLTHPSRRELAVGLTLPTITPYGPDTVWFELYTRGTFRLQWTVKAPYSWIRVSSESDLLVPGADDHRVLVSIEWKEAPTDFDEVVQLDIRTTGGDYGPYGDDFEQVHLRITNRQVPPRFKGFVQGADYVSIPATRTMLPTGYRSLPHVGRSLTGVVAAEPGILERLRIDESPFITYQVYLFEDYCDIAIDFYFNMTLDVDPDQPMTYDIRVDGGPVEEKRLLPDPQEPGELPPGWFSAVQDYVWKRQHFVPTWSKGQHEIQIRFRHTNLMLEKIVCELGNIHHSLLGPPTSVFKD